MSDDNWKTIRVPKDAWQEAKAQKDEHGRTWGQQLVCSNDATMDENVVEEMKQQLDRIENAQADTVSAAFEQAEQNPDMIAEAVVDLLTAEVFDPIQNDLSVSLDATERQKIVEELAREMQR